LDSDYETIFRRRAGLINVKSSNPQRKGYGAIPNSAVEPKEFIDFQRRAYKILSCSFGAFEIDTSTYSINETSKIILEYLHGANKSRVVCD
jgi:cytidylate kinase